MLRRIIHALFLANFAAAALVAQIATSGSTLASLSTIDTRSAKIVAGASSTLMTFIADPSAGGGDQIDLVYTDPSVVISLVLPGGAEVTTATAASLGFGFTTFSALSDAGHLSFTLFGRVGYHVLVQFPSGQPAGTYSIKANASAATVNSAMSAVYLSSSGLRTGLVAEFPLYQVGDTVNLLGLVFDGTTPVTSATFQTFIWRISTIASGLSLANYVQTGQTSIDANTIEYSYKADLTNNGSALFNVVATASTTALGAQVTLPKIVFGDVASSSVTTSANVFKIQLPVGQTFNPSLLTWTFQAQDLGTSVTLTDGGALDTAAGDGVYTGSFTPPSAGDYVAITTTTGTSTTGVPFSRTASADFSVAQPMASFATNSIADSSVGTPITQINVTASATVQAAGSYIFSVELKGSNGQIVTGSNTLTLSTGSQNLTATFPAAQLASLGNGPYSRQWLRLRLLDSDGNPTLAAQLVDGGQTAAYLLSSLDQGAVYFTGTNTAAGVDTTSSGSFDLLRVQLGVVTPASYCTWSGTLISAAGDSLSFTSGGATLPGGTSSITLDFDGNLIAQSGVPGPYTVTHVGLSCQVGGSVLLPQPWQTGPFTVAQFHLVPQSLAVALNPSPVYVNAGAQIVATATVTSGGGFTGVVALSVAGLPTGATATFFPDNQLPSSGSVAVTIYAAPNLALGTYPITVSASSGSISASTNATLNITMPDFAITAAPATITEAPTSQASILVTVTPLYGFNSLVSLSATGLPAGATPSFQPNNVSGGNPSNSTLTLATTGMAPGTYSFTITATAGTLVRSIPATLVVNATALPYPWTTQGIGANSTGGSASHTTGAFTVTPAGNNLSSTVDSFQFTSQTFSADGTIITRIASLQNATATAKAGLMIRQSTDPASPSVYFGFNGSGSLILQSRATAAAAYQVAFTAAAPALTVWIKLVQSGSTFTASTSADGARWTTFGSPVSVTLAPGTLVGLAASSEPTGPSAIAVFDHSLGVPTATPDYYLADPQPVSRATGPNSLTATYAFAVQGLNGFTGAVALGTAGLPPGATAAFLSPTLSGALPGGVIVSALGVANGTYTFAITATSGASLRYTYATLNVTSNNVGIADPLLNQTIGSPVSGGGTTANGSSFTLAAGGQVDGTSDAFEYLYQPLPGDGEIVARLAAIPSAITGARYGVMIRDSLAVDSPYAMLAVVQTVAGTRADFSVRASQGAAPSITTGTAVPVPVWLRVTRVGSIFSAFTSSDHSTWTAVGTPVTVAMNGLVVAGAAVSSNTVGQLASGTFDGVSIGSPNAFTLAAYPAARTIPTGAASYFHSLRMATSGSATGTATLSATGLPAGLTASFTPAALSAGTVANLRLDATAALAAGAYTISVTATAAGSTQVIPLSLTVTSTGTPLPSPWSADEIGMASAPGTSTFGSGTFTTTASGATIDGSSDSFRFTYQPMTGDGTFQARMVSWTTRFDTSKVGIMIRESLLPGAAHAYMRLRADVLVGTLLGDYPGFQYRQVQGGTSSVTEVPNAAGAPYWFRIVRSGNNFTGFGSLDGRIWSQIGQTVPIPMGQTVFIGYAVSSGNDGVLSTVNFDSPLLANQPDFVVQSLVPSKTVPLGSAVGFYTVNLDPLNGHSTPVTLSVSGLPAGATADFTPAAISSGNSLLRVHTSPTVAAGTYNFTVQGTDGTITRSSTSTLVVDGTTATPSAPWSYDYVGATPPGIVSATQTGTTVQIQTDACCASGLSDSLVYTYQALAGDGSISSRVDSVSGSGSTGGLMIRTSLDPGAPNVALSVSNSTGNWTYSLQNRGTQGGTTTTLASGVSVVPGSRSLWLKMARESATVTPYISVDGIQWVRLTDPTPVLGLTTNGQIGIFAAGATATFGQLATGTSSELLVSAVPSRIYSMNAQSGTIELTVYPTSGTPPTAPVYSVTGLPAGVTVAFSDPVINNYLPNAFRVQNKRLTVTAAANAVAGTYPITINAVSGTWSGSTTTTLVVGPGFNVSPASSAGFETSISTPVGFYSTTGEVNYNWQVAITYIGGYTGTVFTSMTDDMANPGGGVSPIVFPTSVTGTGAVYLTSVPVASKEYIGIHQMLIRSGNIDQLIPLQFGPEHYPPGGVKQVGKSTTTWTENWGIARLQSTDPVTLSIGNVPAGMTVSIPVNPFLPTTPLVPVTFTVDSTIALGTTYTLVTTAASPSFVSTATYAVTVLDATWAVSPATVNVAPGNSGVFTGTLTWGTGATPISLSFSATGQPPEASVSFSRPAGRRAAQRQ